MMVCSLAWPSASLVMQVWRRSWKRTCKPARFKAARHAVRQDLMGREASILSAVGCARSMPAASQAGKTKSSALDSGNRPAHLIRAPYAGGFNGISRPVPPSVLLLPTVRVRLKRSI